MDSATMPHASCVSSRTRLRRLGAAVLGITFSVAGVASADAANAQQVTTTHPTIAFVPHPDANAYTTNIIAQVNYYRRAYGLPSVMLSNAISTAAQRHCEDMVRMNRLTHTGSDGSNGGTRISRTGFPWTAWGENLGVGQPSSAAVVTAWMNSSGHRANILNRRFTWAGAAMVPGRGTYWWCLDLADR